jgi:hypothetical protein
MASYGETGENFSRLERHLCPGLEERWVFTIWPSLGMFRLGRWIGRLVGVQVGWRPFFTVGNLLALLLVPLVLILYLAKYYPSVYRRYRITNRRIVVERGYHRFVEKAIDFRDFDRVEVEYQPGYRTLRSGDLVFYRDEKEVFRLPAVPQPEAYCHAIRKLHFTLRAFEPIFAGMADGGKAPASNIAE